MSSLKERYIKHRNNNSLDIQWFYDYYVAHCGKNCKSREEFQEFFPVFIQMKQGWLLNQMDKLFITGHIKNKEGHIIAYL